MLLKKIKQKARLAVAWLGKNVALVYRLLFVILYPVIITVMMGYVVRYTFSTPFLSSLRWIYKFPVPFVINCLIILSLTTFIWLITKRKALSVAVVSVLMAVMSLINYFKMSIRGEPVYPGDFLFPGEAANIAGGTKLIVPLSIYVFVVVIIILCIASYYLKLPNIGRKKRAIYIVSILTATILSYPLYFANPVVQKAIGAEDAIWNQVYNYEKNGLLNAFLMQLKYLQVDKPDGYSKSAARELLKKSAENVESKAKTPNVIVIMSESFWDPTRLPNVTFNIDPLESFRKVQTNSIYGDLLVEPFGGNTANTEFEALTGFSMNALPGGVAYQQYIKRSTPSLPSLLKGQGYTTEAIHPYDAWFWNRQVVYPLLGLDKFYSKTSFPRTDYKGRYVSDAAVKNRIISEYELSQTASDKPFFAHIVTMQNHGWYNTDRYSGSDQQVFASSTKLDPKTVLELNTYSQGVKDASDSLGQLVEYFSKISEPTVIVFFGDHLPSIGKDYGMYRSSGYVSKDNLTNEDLTRLHTIPFVIWSNTEMNNKDVGVINANYLIPTMLESADMTMSSYFSYLSTEMDGAKACNKTFCLTGSGKYVSAESLKIKLNNQAILQYYYLFD